jgi:DNA replication protein
MKEQISKVLIAKKFVVSDYLINVAVLKKLSLEEFLVLLYLDNNYNDKLDIDLISKILGLELNVVMEAFNSLMMKNLVSLDTISDSDKKSTEKVNLDGLYSTITDKNQEEVNEEKTIDIYQTFERKLGRTLSSNELEIINGWLSCGTSLELIIGALDEAIYNGAPRFRYIDKIIYEWEKKGFKSMEDVNNHLMNNRVEKDEDKEISKKEQDILEFDWLNNDN